MTPSTPLHSLPSLSAQDSASREIRDDVAYRVLRAGAIYDLVVTVPFATPVTAAWTLALMGALHERLGLGGAPLPTFAPSHLLFVSFFGTIVTIWAYLRATSRARIVHVLDTIGRGAFSAWMVWALLSSASRTVAPFLVLEVGFFVAQAWALRRDSRAS